MLPNVGKNKCKIWEEDVGVCVCVFLCKQSNILWQRTHTHAHMFRTMVPYHRMCEHKSNLSSNNQKCNESWYICLSHCQEYLTCYLQKQENTLISPHILHLTIYNCIPFPNVWKCNNVSSFISLSFFIGKLLNIFDTVLPESQYRLFTQLRCTKMKMIQQQGKFYVKHIQDLIYNNHVTNMCAYYEFQI